MVTIFEVMLVPDCVILAVFSLLLVQNSNSAIRACYFSQLKICIVCKLSEMLFYFENKSESNTANYVECELFFLDKYTSQFGTGNQYAYYHDEDETTFHLVDTARVQKPPYQRGRFRGNIRNMRLYILFRKT